MSFAVSDLSAIANANDALAQRKITIYSSLKSPPVNPLSQTLNWEQSKFQQYSTTAIATTAIA